MVEKLEDWSAEAQTLLDLCWNAIRTAITSEDGLDSGIGQNLMGEIRGLQDRNPNPE